MGVEVAVEVTLKLVVQLRVFKIDEVIVEVDVPIFSTPAVVDVTLNVWSRRSKLVFSERSGSHKTIKAKRQSTHRCDFGGAC